MKFQLDHPAGLNLFSSHGNGYVAVNGQRFERSLIVTPAQVIEQQLPATLAALATAHFEFLRGLNPEIVLLGTGATLRFPSPALGRCLAAARIGLEVMDSSAACRTYNILVAEGRNVVAAVLISCQVIIDNHP